MTTAGTSKKTAKKVSKARRREKAAPTAGDLTLERTPSMVHWEQIAMEIYVANLMAEALKVRALSQDDKAKELEGRAHELDAFRDLLVARKVLVTPYHRDVMRIGLDRVINRLKGLVGTCQGVHYADEAVKAEKDRLFVEKEVLPRWLEPTPRSDPQQTDIQDPPAKRKATKKKRPNPLKKRAGDVARRRKRR